MKIDLKELRLEARPEPKEPEAGELYAEKIKIAAMIRATGYDDRDPALYHGIVAYAARYRLGCQRRGLLLMGGTGCGKTEGAKRLAALLGIHFITVADIMAAFGNHTQFLSLILQRRLGFREPQDIVIDEVGIEPRPYCHLGTRYNIMAEVLLARYNAFKSCGARTILTTNLTLEGLRQAYGERIESRCWEAFRFIMSDGADYRKTFQCD